jgi:hypothetical protein
MSTEVTANEGAGGRSQGIDAYVGAVRKVEKRGASASSRDQMQAKGVC